MYIKSNIKCHAPKQRQASVVWSLLFPLSDSWVCECVAVCARGCRFNGYHNKVFSCLSCTRTHAHTHAESERERHMISIYVCTYTQRKMFSAYAGNKKIIAWHLLCSFSSSLFPPAIEAVLEFGFQVSWNMCFSYRLTLLFNKGRGV